ncbi:diphthamide biosynthesis enzyme Dph2 [Candidatus Woesearchaeota archaeon]|nr:diphthamide biosynthesis enzyme Dph2 [Candidatus Woesearchaeota archaeon]
MEVMFVEAKAKKKVNIGKSVLNKLKDFKTIGLVATVQFVSQLPEIKSELKKAEKQIVISKPNKHAVYPGQVLGCDVSAAIKIQNKVDCFLYIGDGKFHPLGIAVQTNKPVIILNPYTNKVNKLSDAEKKKWLKKQAARVSKVRDAQILGILVTTKPGQQNLKRAEQIKKKLQSQGKQAFVFVADTINPNDLLNFPQIQAWINTACPRLVDDQELFKKSIANADEINI